MKITAASLIEAPKSTRDVAVSECFSCGRSYSTGDGRFCDPRCRAWFDAGKPPYNPNYANKSNPHWYDLPMRRHGFLIPCAGCGKTSDSKGLRCCSTTCERTYRARQETIAAMAEVAMEQPAKRRCIHCGSNIRSWLNAGTPKAKRVSKTRKFCSPTCQSRYARRRAFAEVDSTGSDPG